MLVYVLRIRKILVSAKSRFIAISIAAGVLRPIAILVTIFPPVAMISVVKLPARIGVERLISVHVFASLLQTVLITSSISNIGAIAIASVIAAVIYSFIPIGVPVSPAPVHALVTRTEAATVTMTIGILIRLHGSHPLLISAGGLPPVWFSKIVRVVFTPFVPTSVVTIAKTLLIAVLSRLAIVGLVVAIIVVMILSVREAAECYDHGKC
jgi:hypothetical protein